jgi:hypothetical protein
LTKSEEAGAEMSFRFTGSAVNVICKKAPDGGFADVYLDGEYQGTVDTYQPSARFRKTLYGAHNLDPDKSHELRVMVKGIKHPESAGTYVYMDAIEVVG